MSHRTNEVYRGDDGNWTIDHNPNTFPAQAQEALDLAVAIQEKLRGDWAGQGGMKDGVKLGLAARICEEYFQRYRTDKPKTP